MTDHNAALPLWITKAQGVTNPYVDTHGVDHKELRLRELKLPPGVRFSKPKMRDLRDAYLGMSLLSDVMIPYTMKPAPTATAYLLAYAQRQNGATQLRMLSRELEEKMTPEEVTQCREAAQTMLAWTMHQWRTVLARKTR